MWHRNEAYGDNMNDKLLAPVQNLHAPGRLLTIAALSSLLFGVVGCTAPGSTDPSAPQPTAADSASDAQGPNTDTTAPGAGDDAATSAARDVVDQAPDASAAEALAAAQKRFAGNPTKIALDHRVDGTLEYDIELVSNTEKYEVELGADTLEVLSEEREPLDPGDDDLQEVFELGAVVDLDKAAATARQSQPGAINEWTLEGDSSGSVVYEFDVVPTGANDDVEVRVDALTGELLPASQ